MAASCHWNDPPAGQGLWAQMNSGSKTSVERLVNNEFFPMKKISKIKISRQRPNWESIYNKYDMLIA